MGGSISRRQRDAAAEANIFNDPEAAQIVFQAGWPLTMVGLDVGDRPCLQDSISTNEPDPRPGQ